MVARINTGKSISKALNYNEQKVLAGKATILSAVGFIKDADRLSFYDKINQFERHISLNDATKTNTLHVSLNFDPTDKIADEKLIEIATAYMDGIGFGSQPFLVYRHDDSGHPHIHIVSTNIEKDGKRISMHNLGRNQSEKVRKEIEIDFSLVKAESKNIVKEMELVPLSSGKIVYGKSETKRAIANILLVVLNQYKFASLPELNAVLKLYNVAADRGEEGSRIYEHRGLVFQVLDQAGNKIGVPIKASAFYMKPTLANLEKMFAENESLKIPFKKRIQTTISWVLNKPSLSLEAFVKELAKENISVVLRRGKDEVIYGITYVDHKTKSVFNGSDLGKEYSAKAILEKCSGRNQLKTEDLNDRFLKAERIPLLQKKYKGSQQAAQEQAGKLLESLTSPSKSIDYVPQQLLKKKSEKRDAYLFNHLKIIVCKQGKTNRV
jgi:hypothetical protein